ncbi:MAG: helicase HerA domain-containing protein, partial [Phototrophicaceae bacterium]
MPFIEAPTNFYLGRRYDPETRRLVDDVVYYDSRDLTTHAIVVGMTGSGKTGLCISMLEEATLDNIPAIVIDPKGDITNLLLNFPELRPEDFQPWVNADDARRAGLDLPEYAADVAARWRDGLQSWGIVPERLLWLKKVAQYSIFTPGSDAGLPISILASLRAPREGWAGNEEFLREKINAITTALLALTGKNAQPVQDREHVLIANIFEHAWKQGIDLTLEDVIHQVQKPPFNTLGVFPINDFMSERARSKLAMDLNNIIAAPSFQSWLQGEPLDIQNLLYQPNGRPRVSIFYTAHLNEAERQFMVTLLLENILGWMRTLSGTTSLRALLYIDEMFGYFPPYPRNPPTKEPIVRLLKQARAFGLGLILATQNPGDLDYKGLSNAGTWFIGRLQSENDKHRVIDGLRSMASTDDEMQMSDVEHLIADIAPRVFLMRNVHDDNGPLLLHTRWAMSYLRGPLTRQQVQILMKDQRAELMRGMVPAQQTRTIHTAPVPGLPPGAPPVPPPPVSGAPNTPPPPASTGFGAQSAMSPVPSGSQAITPPQGFSGNPPALHSSIDQYFLPVNLNPQAAVSYWEEQNNTRAQNAQGGVLVYVPVLKVQALVRYQDRKANIYTARTFAYRVPDVQLAGIIHWDDYLVDPLDARAINPEPAAQVGFGELPPGLSDNRRLSTLRREVTDMLYNTALLKVPHNPDLKIYGNPDAGFNEFRAAVSQAVREGRDAELDKLSARYAGLMDKLEERLRRKEIELRAEEKELGDRRREEMFTTGEALLSLWRGRTNYTLSRMSRATRYRRQTTADIKESHDTIASIEQEMGRLEEEFEQALNQIN